MRMMYVHAYQSYIWNHMVTARLTEFDRTKALVGDLVLDPVMAAAAEQERADDAVDAVDAAGKGGETKAAMEVEGAEAAEGQQEEDGDENEEDVGQHLDAFVKGKDFKIHIVVVMRYPTQVYIVYDLCGGQYQYF